MNKTLIGLIFIVSGLAYGSLALEKVNQATVGFLLKNGWLKAPNQEKISRGIFGPKFQILVYAGILIIIGMYILWNRNT